MPNVSGVSGASGSEGAQPRGTEGFFSSESFLKILAVELQNQDPLEPMSNSDYIAQMASFSNLDYQSKIADGLSALALSSGLTQGAALIGKSVSYLSASAVDPLSGVVERLTVSDGVVTLVVNGEEVALADVTEVAP